MVEGRFRGRASLLRLVRRLVAADSWAASGQLVERHPVLLTDQAEDLLDELVAAAVVRGDDAAVRAFTAHRDFLRRWRVIGPNAVGELVAGDVPPSLRSRWVAAEAAHERYRGRPGRRTLFAALTAVTGVVHDDAFRQVPPEHRAGILLAAGTLLGEHYQRHGGEPASLDESVDCFSRAVADLPAGAAELLSALSGLGAALGLRYESSGDPDDLTDAIDACREAVTAASAEDRWWVLHNLATNLALRHEIQGRPEDLADAVENTRAALGAQPPEEARAALVNGLAALLVDRFELRGTIDDLEAAIALGGALPPRTPREDRAALLATLGTALQRHAERLDPNAGAAQANRAVACLEEAASLLGRRSPALSGCWNALGQAYLTRFEITGTPADLPAARSALARAIRATAPGDPQAGLVRSAWARVELLLARAGSADVDLDEVVSALESTIARDRERGVVHPLVIGTAASARRLRHELRGDPADLVAALDGYRRGASESAWRDPEVALSTAVDWGDRATGRGAWAEAREAYAAAFDAADRLRRSQLSRGAKESWLGETPGLTAAAVWAAARSDDPQGAVLFAERGRARLLAEGLEITRLDLARLASRRSEVARRYREVAGRLAALQSRVHLGEG